jgi:hypothetical protein
MVQPCGVTVLAPAAFAGFDEDLDGAGRHGTGVVLLLKSPMSIVSIDDDRGESRLTSFTDDKGKDLTRSAKFENACFESSVISSDHTAALVRVMAPNTPMADATKVSVKGTLKVTLAADKKFVEVKNVILKKGEIKVPGYKLSIVGVSEAKGFNGKPEFCVSIFADGGDASRLESIEFLDAAGKPINVQRRQGLSSGGNVDSLWSDYVFEQKSATATLRLNFWKDVKTVVPVDITATLGVAAAK